MCKLSLAPRLAMLLGIALLWTAPAQARCLEGQVKKCPDGGVMECVDGRWTECENACTPHCTTCGAADGCGGVCQQGACPTAFECVHGSCVCVPNCEGKQCGEDDGCNGSCNVGTCSNDISTSLRLGTVGLRKDIAIDRNTSAMELRRAPRNAEIVFVGVAEDSEYGIARVALEISLHSVCNGVSTSETSVVERLAPSDSGSAPRRLSTYYTHRFGPQRHCRGESRASISVIARATNGAGALVHLQTASVGSYGPDTIRVGTFNLYWPGNHPDTVYTRWGETLGRNTDILVLTEVLDQRRADLVAAGAGMTALKMPDGDVAVLSRGRIYNTQSRTINPPGRLSSNDSHIFSVTTDLDGYAHQVVGTHWGIRDANDVLFGADASAPARQAAANAILSMLPITGAPAFVAGDMNAYSGSGPQDHDLTPATPDYVGSTTELDILLSRLSDPFRTLAVPNDMYCSNSRIDYVLAEGTYRPISYEACFSDAAPSDHPFVKVTYEASDP